MNIPQLDRMPWIHSGAPFSANLGDGAGPRNQSVEYRGAFGNSFLGTCIEQFLGGNYLRVFGPQAGSGALSLACVPLRPAVSWWSTDGYVLR